MDLEIEYIELVNEGYTGDDKDSFSKIAGMMKQNQYNEIIELYIELEVVQIYFDYKSTPPLENRKNIAIAIRKNVALIMQKNREKFIKLADHIEDGKKNKAKKIFNELTIIYGGVE
ncbi:hypothetical protein FHR92_001545 [Fontibacillus solani]|uniref:Uncharacterized protein n=1 Tax=Fontibacillus solani TaxID=1572857 RepID=A0A7W3XR19_9BACL|nr:hypothetical protein [Fontibacillus solani]MBA9085083.1 hypothetical protein [Fontibacillus solani]